MNGTIKAILVFAAGAAVGVAASWKYFDTKYSKIAQEEIDSVKEVYSKKQNQKNEIDISEPVISEEDVSKYKGCIIEEGYSDLSDEDEVTANVIPIPPAEEIIGTDEPYVISPEEFGEIDSYTLIGFTYYADCVLTDENDEIVEDVDKVIGWDSLNCFGEYEDDSVHVRNDRLRCDYEIIRVERKYSEVLKEKPYLARDLIDNDEE